MSIRQTYAGSDCEPPEYKSDNLQECACCGEDWDADDELGPDAGNLVDDVMLCANCYRFCGICTYEVRSDDAFHANVSFVEGDYYHDTCLLGECSL